VVRPKTSDVPWYFLLGILNSRLVKFFLRECYGALAMDGGISFTPTNTSEIPFPSNPSKTQVARVCRAVEKILEMTRSESEKDIVDLQSEADQAVYQAFRLTEAEIRAVDQSFASTASSRARAKGRKKSNKDLPPFE
jgi:hypothetical protein